MVAGSVKQLIRMTDGICHYCNRRTVASDSERFDRYPTKDHVVPRSFGGRNHISNYVLACASCNNKRGTSMFFCSCRNCRELILDALFDNSIIDTIINGIENHNRPKITKLRRGKSSGMWNVRIGHNMRVFKTHSEAVDFAINGSCVKDKDYGQD